ncbi:hypothetical protein HY404_00550 [Candidatus Microgenomates bacterium]|nr:hypothetical protein [Candidatus Microgenomates bacterium]
MDQTAPQSSNIIKTGSDNSLKIIISFLTLFLGLVIGIFSSPYILPQKDINNPAQPSNRSFTQEKQVKEPELPISLELLKNPLLYEWRVGAKGKLIAKDDDKIVLQDSSGHTLTVPNRLSRGDDKIATKFYIVEENGQGGATAVKLEVIPLGVQLYGSLFIKPIADNKNRILGDQFIYDKRLQK